MPNLVGIWDPELLEDSIKKIVAKQLNRVRVTGSACNEYSVIFPGFGMALQDPSLLDTGIQPVLSSDKKTALLLDGEINNASELRVQFSTELGNQNLSPPELALRLISQHGPSAARLFNGFFCILLYESTARRLTIITDRYGARPLFYVQRGNVLLFGTELKALAAVDAGPRKVDEVGVMELFCYGSHFMDRTWMEGYRKAPPAAVLTIQPEGVKVSRYWTYGYDVGAGKLTQNTYATVFAVLLDRAVERRMHGTKRIGIFLSGGYDSRSVAAAIRKHRRPIPAFTFGLPESRDVRFGTMLANRLGLDHRVITVNEPYLYKNCRAIVWRTEGMLPFANATSIHIHSILKAKMDIILTGFLGEFSGSHTWAQLLLARSRQAAIAAIFSRFLEPKLALVQRLFQPAFFKRVSAAVRESFYKSFENVSNDHPMDIADSWNFMNLQPRGTFHAPSVDRHILEMRAPHTDNDLVDFLLTISPATRLEQRVYKKMIAYSYPEILSVPCTNSARPIEPNFAKEYSRMVMRFAAAKTTAAFRKRMSARPELGREFRDLGEDFRAEPELVDLILKPLLRAGGLPDSIFNHSAIDQIIREHYEQKATHQDMLGLLISLGLALKFFMYDELSDAPGDLFAPAANEALT